jgi:hypothetical protein
VNGDHIFGFPSSFAGVIWHRFSPPAVVGFGSLWLYYTMGIPICQDLFSHFIKYFSSRVSDLVLRVFCGFSVSLQSVVRCFVVLGCTGLSGAVLGPCAALQRVLKAGENRTRNYQMIDTIYQMCKNICR